MLEGLFPALRNEGVLVALDEWLMLHDALERDLHQSTLRFFHNCVYDRVYTTPDMRPSRAESTRHLLAQLDPDYKLVMVDDACMAPSELLMAGGAVDYQYMNEEPRGQWLERLEEHFSHAVWLNPHPKR